MTQRDRHCGLPRSTVGSLLITPVWQSLLWLTTRVRLGIGAPQKFKMETLVACLVCLVIVLGLVPTAVAHAAALAVTKCSFSPSSITLGAAGACRMCLVRDVDLAPDETVAPYPFSHTGDSTTAAVSFMPKIAGRYRLGLVFNGSNVWAHPNGPSRLVVRGRPPLAWA